MVRKDYTRNILGRRYLTIALCAFLLTSALVPMISAGVKTSGSQNVPEPIKNPVRTDGSTESLTYSFLFTEPEFSEVTLLGSPYTKINMPGTITTGLSTGAPAMPVKIVRFLLPPGRHLKSISVSGATVEINMKGVDLQQKPVLPYQKPAPLAGKLPQTIDFDTAIYTSQETYPKTSYVNQGIGYCRGYQILAVDLHPMQYIPAQEKLLYSPEVTVSIEMENTGFINPYYRINPEDLSWVQTLVYNPEIAEYYGDPQLPTLGYPGGICDPSQQYDYVIITTTTNGLNHWATTPTLPYNWTSLLTKHATDDGLTGTLVTVQQIYAEPAYQNSNPLFNDNPARIREFCKDAYQDWGTQYILIAGDDDYVPARHMQYEYESGVDSDLYWTNLDNTFNVDQDGAWGEEGDAGFDLYSELYIGRITCDQPIDVSNWMKKSFYYADSTEKTYLDNAAFYGGALGWNAQGDDFIDYGAIKGTSNWLGPSPGAHGAYPSWLGFQYGFETWNSHNIGQEYNMSVKWTAEPPNPGWSGGSESVAINGLKTAINANKVTLISAVAHADASMSMDVGMSDWANQYTNTMPFFIFDFGCHCGDIDAVDDGVVETMMFHSNTELAFACLYNTCYGWGSLDDTNSSSALHMKLFWDYLFDTMNNSGGVHNWQLGKANAWAKDAMAPTIGWTYDGAPGSWRGIIQGAMFFGDPAQRIKPPLQPEHNVGVQTLDVSSHEPANANIWVGTTIFNNGKHNETNVEVRFLVNNVQVNSSVIPFFAKNSVQTTGWWYHTPSQGWETLSVNVTMVPGENISTDNVRSQDVIYGPDIAVSDIQAPDYLGQGYAQPVKGYIQNLGPTNEVVTVQFIANNLLQNSTQVSLSSGQSTWVTFQWNGMGSGLGTYNATFYAIPVPNEYYVSNNQKSHLVTVFAALANILLVDDDEGASYESWYANALMAAQCVYQRYDRNSLPAPSASLMQGYTAVVWFTGSDSYTTLESTDEANLQTYLNNGGKLFISGQEIGYDIGGDSFYQNYLKATYSTDSAGFSVAGVTGDPIGDWISFGITGGDGANNQQWPDGIQPRTGATSCFFYSDATQYKAGIKVDTGVYRLVYFSFGFEGIDNMADRTLVMSRVLNWLTGGHDIQVTSLTAPDNAIQGEPITVSATILNHGFNNEANIIVDFTIDGIVQDTTVINQLLPAQSIQVDYSWIPVGGSHIAGVFAHPVTGEMNTTNNHKEKTISVIIRQNDVGVLTINYPPDTLYAGSCTVNATVKNYGDLSQGTVLVGCSIYGEYMYSEDFEASNGGYIASGTPVWEWGVPTTGPGAAHSGTKLWATKLNTNYPANADAKLTSISLDLPPIPLELSYWQWYQTESYYDGGNVKISTDGGNTWTILGSYQNPYPEDAASSTNVGIPGEPCFSGTAMTWQKITFDLSAYGGKTVMIRWHFGSDYSVTRPGWYIDDAMITSTDGVVLFDITPLYTAETTVAVSAHSTALALFTPPWLATAGTYYVRVETSLPGDENSGNDVQINKVTVLGNNPPLQPTLSGPVKGIEGNEYTYTASTNDPEGSQVYYFFDWGDNTNSGWLGPYNSGATAYQTHSWTTFGVYQVTVKSKDAQGAESSWSTPLSVRMYLLGDTNPNNDVSFDDINPFVLMLTEGEAAYYQAFPDGYYYTGDINQDGVVNFGDINPFVALLSGS